MWTLFFRRAGKLLPVAAALGLLASTSVCLAQGEAGETAVWKAKELNFFYMGFTTHYSCEGLADKVKTVLLALGARKDVVAYGTGCASSYGRPTPAPGVRIRMNVLEPIAAGAKAGSTTVPAHWKKIDLKLDSDPVSESGECELVEQIRQKIIPLFTVRNVEFKSTCVPHQLNPGTRLTAQVLMADRVAVDPAAPDGVKHDRDAGAPR